MSVENEEQRPPDEDAGNFDGVFNKPKKAYAKEFLLSFSSLDICKKLPNDFDESLLSEFEDALLSTNDRPRIPGSLPLQGFRRNEYGSSPPTRGDSSNYTRGVYGRWDSRPSGRSDRDSDSQSDRDSESGRYGQQHRRSWQSTSKDGLLGSGALSRPSGYAAGTSAPKAKSNDHYQLSKSNEPYHPPRPYKGVPYSRRETDAHNDETFGSMECTSEDIAEEKRRRASFEMIRIEQQKVLQEKHKLKLEKHKSSEVFGLSGDLEVKHDEQGHIAQTNGLDVSSVIPASSHDLEKSLPSHNLASRPRVPPGFKSNLPEKRTDVEYPTHHLLLEEGNQIKGEKENLLDPKFNLLRNANVDGLEQSLSQDISPVNGQSLVETSLMDKLENMKLHKISDAPISKSGIVDPLHSASSLLGPHGTFDDPLIVDLNAVRFEDKTVVDANSASTSILEKIFGSSLSMNGDGASPAKHRDSKHEDTWSPNSVQSSKFAQWFVEEEVKPVDPIPSQGENDLLSLIVGGDKGKQRISESKANKEFLNDFSSNTLEQTERSLPDFLPVATGVTDQAFPSVKESTSVLTCEDLEQSILTEYTGKTGNQPKLEGWSNTDSSTEQPVEHADDQASFHLLSLLQKGANQSTLPVNNVSVDLGDRSIIFQGHDVSTPVDEHRVEEGAKSIPSPGKNITLETLFGSAFMQELQSVEAPVSVQRGSNGLTIFDTPDTHGLHFPVADNITPSLAVDKNGLQGPSLEPWAMAPNPQQPAELSKAANWTVYNDSETGTTSGKHHVEEVSRLGNSLNHRLTLSIMPQHSMNNVTFSSNAPLTAVSDERVMTGSESLPFTHGPYKNMDPKLLYHGLQGQQLPPQFQPPQMAQMHNHLDSHVSSQMKFLGPDSMFNYDSGTNRQFPSSMIQRPFHHGASFNVPPHSSMLHQMQMSGNPPPPHVLHDLPRGDTTSHSGNQIPGFLNQMQGFSTDRHQPNIANQGFPIPGNTSAPEAFQRLMEMEMHQQRLMEMERQQRGAYGGELDMGLHYR